MFGLADTAVTLTPSKRSHRQRFYQVEAVEVERDAAGGDLDAVLAGRRR
mgnify:CR=1 FL=1